MNDDFEVIDITCVKRVRIVSDTEPEEPDYDHVQIAYAKRSRYCLGTEGVSEERLDEISEGIKGGTLIGLPVYAYVHGASTISTTPFSCPWDSGRSGFVYVDKAQYLKDVGRKLMSGKLNTQALLMLSTCVEEFACYLRGEVYGYIVEVLDEDSGQWCEGDSCYGFIGLEHVRKEATEAGQ